MTFDFDRRVRRAALRRIACWALVGCAVLALAGFGMNELWTRARLAMFPPAQIVATQRVIRVDAITSAPGLYRDRHGRCHRPDGRYIRCASAR